MAQDRLTALFMLLDLECHRNGIHNKLWVQFLLPLLYKLEVEHPLADNFWPRITAIYIILFTGCLPSVCPVFQSAMVAYVALLSSEVIFKILCSKERVA